MSTSGFATSGNSTAFALNESIFGTGQQQRAHSVYAETTFGCAAYWLVEAFTNNNRVAYKYQYSVVGALHGIDSASVFGPPLPNEEPDFNKVFMTIWGNFVTQNNPSISSSIANGEYGTGSGLAAMNFPAWNLRHPLQLNLNQTGG